MSVQIGWFGLGGIGLPMARRMLESGRRVSVCVHRNRAPADVLAADGVRVCPGTAAVAADADVVVSIVRDEAQSDAVLSGRGGALAAMRAGSVLIIMSTVSSEYCQRIAELGGRRGIEVLDAPVSGGAPKAAAGELTVMVGGHQTAFARVRPLLDVLGTNVFRLGDVGAGQAAKIVNNAIKMAVLAATTEGLDMGVRAGLDLDSLLGVLACSTSSSHVVANWSYYEGFKRDHRPGGPLAILAKDMQLARELAARHDTHIPVLEAAAAADVARIVTE